MEDLILAFWDEHSGKVVTGLIASFFAAGSWLVRTVLTNKQEVQMLKAHLKDRDKRRDEDRDLMQQGFKDTRDEMHEMRQDIKGLMQNHAGQR